MPHKGNERRRIQECVLGPEAAERETWMAGRTGKESLANLF